MDDIIREGFEVRDEEGRAGVGGEEVREEAGDVGRGTARCGRCGNVPKRGESPESDFDGFSFPPLMVGFDESDHLLGRARGDVDVVHPEDDIPEEGGWRR